MINKQIITRDIKIPNKEMEVLRKHFSHCFDKNGDFQIEKFKQSISENEISFSKESYSMDWLGKSYARLLARDRKSTRLNSSHVAISYAVFCLKKKTDNTKLTYTTLDNAT